MSPPSVSLSSAIASAAGLSTMVVRSHGASSRARGEDHLVDVDQPLREAHVAWVGSLHVDDGGPEPQEALGVDPAHHARGGRLPEAGQVVARDVGGGVRNHPAHVDRVVGRGVPSVEGEGDVGDDPAAAGLLVSLRAPCVRCGGRSVACGDGAASLSRLWPKPSSMPAMKSAESTVLSVIRTRTSRSVPLAGRQEAEVDVGRESDAAVGQRGGGPVGEALARQYVVDDSLGSPDDHVGAVGVLDVAVLQDDPATRSRLEDELGDAEVVGRPPAGEQGRLGEVAPDQLGPARQRPVEAGTCGRRPSRRPSAASRSVWTLSP